MIKATKKLSNFNFEGEGAAVALVGPAVGGAANGRTTLIYKAASTEAITEEQVEKASMVTVTLSITEYLRKFFSLWSEDAELLARVMGYDTTEEPIDYGDNYWDTYLDNKVAAVTIMKSLVLDKEEDEIAKAISDLPPKDYLTILKSQEQFEKNFENAPKKAPLNKSSSVTAEGVTASKGATSPSVEVKKEEDSMSEFITKAAMQTAVQEAVEKALAPVQTELAKAQETIDKYKQEKVEAVSKSRKEAIAAVEGDAVAAEELFKSLEGVSDAAFEGVMKALKKKEDKVEQSDLMKEVGNEGREVAPTDVPVVNRTLEILKAQFATKGAQ